METKEFRYFRALHQVAVAVNSTLEPSNVLQAVARSATEAMNAKACSIMLLSPDRRELRHAVSHGLSDQYLGKGTIQADQSMVDALRGRSMAVLDATHDPRVQYQLAASVEGIASILSVPIQVRGQRIGVMRIYTASPRQFGQEDVEFVEAVANLGGVALENARRFDAVKSDLDAMRIYVYGAT